MRWRKYRKRATTDQPVRTYHKQSVFACDARSALRECYPTPVPFCVLEPVLEGFFSLDAFGWPVLYSEALAIPGCTVYLPGMIDEKTRIDKTARDVKT